MLNVNELTSRMSKMSDDQLRQYARLHKDDPYTLALASSESKRRAQLRAAGQPVAPRPTVADQRLAEMGVPAPMPQPQPQPQLPEQQGIGMLPAENVQGMADGGIAGYDDQFVDSYADAYAGGGIVAFAGEGPSLVGQGFRRDQTIPAPRSNSFNQLMATRMGEESSQDTVAEIARLENILATTPFGPQREFAEKRLALLRNKAPAAAPAAPTPPVAQADVRRVDNAIDALTVPPQAPPQAKTGTAPRPGAGTTTGPSAEKAPDFVPSKPGDLTAELKRLQEMNPGTKAYDDLSAKIKQGFADLEKAREESKPKEKAYTGLEALLGKEEEKAKGKEARNFNMAIVNAGLAIAGGKSQYAIQNISEGAQVGTKQYQEGLEKLEAAALERRKQNAMIEEARRSEERGDWKEAQQLKQKAFEAGLGVTQAQIAAVQDLYKTDLKTAAEIVNNQNTLAAADQRALMEQREQTKRAREQNISAERVADKYAASRMAGGAGLRGQITPALVLKEYNDLVAKDTLGDFQKRYPTPQHYMAAIEQMMNPTIVSELPQNANVRR